MNSTQLLRVPLVFQKMGNCLFHYLCSQYIDCKGNRDEPCKLEYLMNDNKAPNELISKIRRSKLFGSLLRCNNTVPNQSTLYKSKLMSCPFVRNGSICHIKLCHYFSSAVTNNCMLGTKYSLSDIMVMKDISKKELLLSLMENDRWDDLLTEITLKAEKEVFCECGHFLNVCLRDEIQCKKRKKKKPFLMEESIIHPDIKSFPFILIILMTEKYYGINHFLYHRSYKNLYLGEINESA